MQISQSGIIHILDVKKNTGFIYPLLEMDD